MTIYPVEKVENTEDNITLTYGHAPHTVINDIDRSAPISAELTSLLIDDLIGVGEQLLEGLVFDQSPVAQVTLQTSLGETVNCEDTLQSMPSPASGRAPSTCQRTRPTARSCRSASPPRTSTASPAV